MIEFIILVILTIFIAENISNIGKLRSRLDNLESDKSVTLHYSMEDQSLYTNENGDIIFPVIGSTYSSGFDVMAAESVLLNPGQRYAVRTGLRFEIPEGYEIQVRPRSGLALKFGITVLNTPGTIDEDYTGEVKVILYNADTNQYEVNKGDKIAQLVLVRRNPQTIFVRVNEVLKMTDRGSNGFGSTGN